MFEFFLGQLILLVIEAITYAIWKIYSVVVDVKNENAKLREELIEKTKRDTIDIK